MYRGEIFGSYLCLATVALFVAAAPRLAATEAAAEKKSSGTITVRVLAADGRPTADAETRLFSFDADWRYHKPEGNAKRTDAAGVLRFDAIAINSYLVAIRAHDNTWGLKDVTLLDSAPNQEVEIQLGKPVSASLRVRDASGHAVAGATIYSLYFHGGNGDVFLPGYSFEALGWPRAVSDSNGVLKLPPLPAGARTDIRIMHADYAPATMRDVPIAADSISDVTLQPGVTVTMRLRAAPQSARVDRLMLDLRRLDSDHPSVMVGYHVEFDNQGMGRVTIAEGEYYWLRLRHPDYIVTPTYSYLPAEKDGEKEQYFSIEPGSDTFAFDVKPKVAVRGRVIDQSTVRPIEKGDIGGEVASTGAGGPLAKFGKKWSHAGWAELDKEGRFEIKVAAGAARIEPSVEGYLDVGEHDYVELDVAADGSTVCPDILVRPVPTVRGIVTTTDGKPVARAVVRFTSRIAKWNEPVMTDAAGRFEIKLDWMPTDWRSEQRVPVQMLSAFHPLEPLNGQTEVRLDDPASAEHVSIQLAPLPIPQYLVSLKSEMTAFERGEESREQTAAMAADRQKSLVGQPAPELDGAAWLNTDQDAMSLEELRGKYVLLVFWTTWCGPCHADFPSVKLVHELYKDHGVVVIGVHDNSMPLDAIRSDADKEKLAFPIVVDHADGRLIRRYHVSSLPTYVLIEPNGNVVRDSSVAAPSLRGYKVEVLREFVAGAQGAAR
jgi:thiol-disulfide isomerase/thioredoxin